MKYLKIEKERSFDVVTIDRPKVNAINAGLVEELRQYFAGAEADDSIRGIILTGTGHIFSAGLDLVELLTYDENTMAQFFRDFSALHYELVKFSKPFICAVNGHCPAGGTVIALGADFRVMAEGEKFTIGLNEVSVNVQISEMLIESYGFWLGQKQAYQNVITGKLLKPAEALNHGLVDQVVDPGEVLLVAKKMMSKWLQADADILRNTKLKLRKSWIARIDSCDHEGDLRQASEIWWSPTVRQKMEMYVAMLKAR